MILSLFSFTDYGPFLDKLLHFCCMGFWGEIIGSVLGTAGSLLGNDDEGSPYVQLPDYKESEGARKEWWDRLQSWGSDDYYGAISPNWDDIWSSAQNKVKQYFWGNATGPGIVDKVKASAARRGVSESPALENLIGRMGMQESQQLNDMAVQEATQKAIFGENARVNWLSSLQSLANLKPSFMGQAQTPSTSSLLGNLGTSIGSAISNYEQQNWYENMLNNYLGLS